MQKGTITKDSIQDFKLRALHNITGLPFVVPQYPQKGKMQIVSGPKDDQKLDLIQLNVTVGEETKKIVERHLKLKRRSGHVKKVD